MSTTTFRPARRPMGWLPDGTAYFAPIGEVEYSDDLARCHLCGDWFRSVGVHLRAHGWRRADYRAAFGLERGQPLEGLSTQERRASALRRRRADDPKVRAGCETGRQWARSGALSRAAAEAARGRRQPEQRRRKTIRTLDAIPAGIRAEAATRASVERLRTLAARVAADAGYPTIGDLVRDRVAGGASLAAVSRDAGLHKDWMCRHLSTVDPDAARDIAPLVSGQQPIRHDAGMLGRLPDGFTDVAAFLRHRHLDQHHTVQAIAIEVGMSRPAVEAAMLRHRVPVRAHATVRRRTTERARAVAESFGFAELQDYLDDRRAAGLSWRHISDECGEPASWLRRRAGLQR